MHNAAPLREIKRAVRRVPLWMRPGLPHWAGTFQSVVYLKIVWCARTLHRTTRGTLHSTLHSTMRSTNCDPRRS